MKTVKQISSLTGVSVRTLHHYDSIGLLRPTAITEAGYRLYDDAALQRRREKYRGALKILEQDGTQNG